MISGGGADLCNRAVHVEELQGHSGVRFSNSQMYGDIIVEETNHGPVSFSNCGLFGSVHGANGVALASVAGEGRVSFNDCHVHCIDPKNQAKPLIHVRSGRVQIRGCEFIDGHSQRDHVVLEQGTKSAIVAENISRGKFSIVSQEKTNCIIRDNLSDA